MRLIDSFYGCYVIDGFVLVGFEDNLCGVGV